MEPKIQTGNEFYAYVTTSGLKSGNSLFYCTPEHLSDACVKTVYGLLHMTETKNYKY